MSAIQQILIGVGFTASGWVDMTAYAAFGTGTEKVVKLYNQGGAASADFVQTTLADCGTLVNNSLTTRTVYI